MVEAEREHRVIYLLDDAPYHKPRETYTKQKRLIDKYGIYLIILALRVLQITVFLRLSPITPMLTRVYTVTRWLVKERIRYNMMRRRIPLEKHWKIAQQKYRKWTSEKQDETYVLGISEIGERLALFIGKDVGLCVDLGCGNGVYCGKNYSETGYKYLNPSKESFVIGVDPLPLEGKLMSWLDLYVENIAEALPPILKEKLDTVVIASSLDHFEKPLDALKSSYHSLKKGGRIYIYVTCYPAKQFDIAHITRFTLHDLKKMVKAAKFKITRLHQEPYSASSTTVFLEGSKV